MKNLLVIFMLGSTAVSAGERLTMVDNSDLTSIEDAIGNVVKAFDNEDLDSYELCFKESLRKSIRKKAAYVFADDECSMELVDIHVVENDDEDASAVVKYKMGGSHGSFVVLSEIDFVKEGGAWKIERETVKSKGVDSHRSSSSVASVKPPVRGGAWNPMNPDPNKIPEEIHHLIGDIGVREGFGCVGGRCKVQ